MIGRMEAKLGQESAMMIAMMRRASWERSKAELSGSLATFYGRDPRFIPFHNAVTRFIEEVESNGWVDVAILDE